MHTPDHNPETLVFRLQQFIGLPVTGEENIIECDGLFVSIGRKPTTDFLDNQIELDNKGYIVAGENTETSIPGVYAVGDVRTKLLRQIVTAVADGAMAVHMAEEYVEK